MATLTLKNVPDELYARLKRRAARHRRSLNQEALVCLEMATAHDEAELLEDLDRFQRELAEKGVWVEPADVERFIKEGRA